jgi:hypothetical protein
MAESPISTSPAGCVGTIITILVIDALQYFLIVLSNILKNSLYANLPGLNIPLIFPLSVYDIHIYHIGVTLGTMLIFAQFNAFLWPYTVNIRNNLNNYFTPPITSFSTRQESAAQYRNNRFRLFLLKLGLSKNTYLGLTMGVFSAVYFLIISFITLDQYLYNALFSIGISVILLFSSDTAP